MKKHVNIPVFVPHLGCPNACVFCDQRRISGSEAFAEEHLREKIEINPSDPRYLKVVWGQGYKIEGGN